MYLNESTKEIIKKDIESKLGIPYEQFANLDIDEQERMLKEYRKKNNIKSNQDTIIIVGSGEHAIFTKTKKGSRHMLEDGTFYEAGLSLEESESRLNDRMDDVLYSKPVAFVKKIVRRMKK